MATADIRAVTKLFLDRANVRAKVEKGKLRSLSKFGAFVRTSARSSIRKRSRVGKPGEPPTDRGGALKRLLFFSYDPARGSVVVGPALWGESRSRGRAPALLEYGGVAPAPRDGVLTITNPVGRNERGQFVTGGKARVKITGAMRYEPRPFMRPAFAANLTNPKLTSVLKDVIR